MALSGGHTGTVVGGFSLRIDWTATQDTPNNKSTITAKAYLVIASGWSINIGSKTGVITIDGTDTTITYNLGLKGAGSHLIGTASKTITHNTDGTKSFAISGNAKVEATVTGYGWVGTLSKGSNTYTLDTIPRVSSISLNHSSREIGQTVRITVSRPNSSFTNDIAYQFGNESWVYIQKGVGSYVDWTLPDTLVSKISGSSGTLTIHNETRIDGTYIGKNSTTLAITMPGTSTFTIPTSFSMGSAFTVSITRANSSFTHWVELWDGSTRLYSSGNTVGTSDSIGLALSTLAARSPNSMVRSFTVKVSTYNGSTHIGSNSKVITGHVPSSLEPSFSALTVSENVSEVNTLIGSYVQGKSRLNLAITGASGIYGSSIRSYSIRGVEHSSGSSSTTTGVLQVGGNQTITGAVTDSRGQTYIKSIVVPILSYSAPTIKDLSFKRTTPNGTPDPLGANVTVTANVRVHSLVVNGVERNSIKYNVQSAQKGYSFVDKINTTSPYLEESYNDVISGYAADYPYDFRARAGDIFGFGGWNVGLTPTGAVTQHWGSETTSFGKMIDDTSYNVQVGPGGIHSEGGIVAGLEGILSEGGYVINDDAYDTNNTPDWYFTNYMNKTVIENKRLTSIGISGATGYGCVLVTFVPFTDTWGNQITQVAYGQAGEIYSRNNGTVNWNAWQPVGGGGDVTWGDILSKPTTATRWPSWSEVTSKPTTATRWPSWSEVTSRPSIPTLDLYGNNTNGFYWRFSDGLQICLYTHPTAPSAYTERSITGGYGVHYNWYYPAPFIDADNTFVFITGDSSGWALDAAGVWNVARTYCALGLMSNAAITNVRLQSMAIGRWK